jgi:hypothetical protein
MIHTITPYRPGLAAIAAVLALSSTPLLAQVALPDVSARDTSPPVTAAPVPVASAPVQAPVQTVQSLPPTAPALPNIAVDDTPATVTRAAPVERSAPRTAVRAPVREVAPLQRATPPQPTPASQPAVARQANTVHREAADIRSDVNAMRAGASNEPVATTPISEQRASASMDYASLALLGGGLLLVAGGVTFAMSRKPKRREQVYDEVLDASVGPVATPFVPSVTSPPMTPVVAEPVAPVIAHVREPAPVRQPAFAAERHRDVPVDERHAALEAMIAEAPSEANPFHSRRNRLRRADFLLRTGQVQPDSVPVAARNEEAMPARDRWSEMSFGGKRATRVNWRPATR